MGWVTFKKDERGKVLARLQERQIPALYARAQAVASTWDEQKRTVDVVWTTGARVLRDFWDPFWEELSLDPGHVRMERLNSGRAPVLDSHGSFSTEDVLGVVENARLEGNRGVATLRFPTEGIDPKSDSVFRKIGDGILSDVSVGYQIHRMEKVTGSDSAESDFPTYRATDWEPFEISVVPIGADSGATVRGDAAVKTNACVVEETMGKKNSGVRADADFEDEENDDEKRAKSDEADAEDKDDEEDEESEASDEDDDDGEDKKRSAGQALDVRAQERRRVVSMIRICEKLGLPRAFADKHIELSTSLEKFRGLAIDEVAEKEEMDPNRPNIRVEIPAGGDSRDRFLRGASNALMARTGRVDMYREAAEKKGEKFDCDPGEFRGLSMVDLARMSLARSRVNTSGKSKLDVVGMALTQRAEGGFHGVGDFAVLLENVMHKTLLASYAVTDDTWEKFCSVGTLTDFRPHNRYRMGTFSSLEVVNENGEFRNKTIDDAEKESITAQTVGNIIALSRQALINDDLGAFTRLATGFGRAAKLSIETSVYALLALNGGLGPAMSDTNPLFDSSHKNIGTGSALSVAGLDADRVVMKKQQDKSSNEYLDLRPAILVVPVGLGGAALVINKSTWDVDPVTTNATNNFQKPNKVVGLFETVVDTARISGTRRYLFASPLQTPTIEVGFLEGQRDPFLELQNGWRVDGVEWKVRLDFGVAAVDFRGAVTNAGA